MTSILALRSSREFLPARSRFHLTSPIRFQAAYFSNDADSQGSQIMQSSYQEYSVGQYSAHTACQDMLLESIQRWGQRIQMQDKFSANALQDVSQTLKMADLGAADGSNSIQTLEIALETLDEYRDLSSPMNIVLEEHPDSDEAQLKETLNRHATLFQKHNARFVTKMKSFYEPLFPPNSMDFIMSHLCLHWLDTADAKHPPKNWKQLHLEGPSADDDNSSSDFVFANEQCIPPLLKEVWRKELACRHLAKFFLLRASELRPGAELFVMMVGEGHEFVCPPGRNSSLLTTAMQQCIAEGTLRKEVLTNTIVPYYLRNVQDIYEACNLMNNSMADPNK